MAIHSLNSDTKAIAMDAIEMGRIDDAMKILSEALDPDEAATFVAYPPRAYAKVGDILYSSWGYDQTNIDWYQVVSVSPSGKSANVRKISGRTVEHTDDRGHTTHDTVVPAPGAFEEQWGGGWREKVTSAKGKTCRVQQSSNGGGYRLNINDHETAWLWDGRPKHQTGFGYGH